MAKLIEDLSIKYNLPIISQWEIADIIKKAKNHLKAVVLEHRIKGKYLDTKEVAEQMMIEMKKQIWNNVVIIAHPLHVWRCVKVLEKLGTEEIIIPDGLEIIPFDFQSEQWHTRSFPLWVVKEIPARIFYFLKGWI